MRFIPAVVSASQIDSDDASVFWLNLDRVLRFSVDVTDTSADADPDSQRYQIELMTAEPVVTEAMTGQDLKDAVTRDVYFVPFTFANPNQATEWLLKSREALEGKPHKDDTNPNGFSGIPSPFPTNVISVPFGTPVNALTYAAVTRIINGIASDAPIHTIAIKQEAREGWDDDETRLIVTVWTPKTEMLIGCGGEVSHAIKSAIVSELQRPVRFEVKEVKPKTFTVKFD